MLTVAVIENNVVVNVTVWEEMPVGEQYVDITGIPNVGIGWEYVNGQFIEPVQPEPESEPEPKPE